MPPTSSLEFASMANNFRILFSFQGYDDAFFERKDPYKKCLLDIAFADSVKTVVPPARRIRKKSSGPVSNAGVWMQGAPCYHKDISR